MSWLIIVILLLSNCGATDSVDPTERGLSYVATAIVFAAILRACTN